MYNSHTHIIISYKYIHVLTQYHQIIQENQKLYRAMSESTFKAQECLRAFVDGKYDESLSLIDQVEEPHKLKDDKYGATLLHWAVT